MYIYTYICSEVKLSAGTDNLGRRGTAGMKKSAIKVPAAPHKPATCSRVKGPDARGTHSSNVRIQKFESKFINSQL